MLNNLLFFVSYWSQRPALALTCLMAIQLLGTLASCQPEPSAMAARVGLAR